MAKSKTYLIVLSLFILAFFAGSFVASEKSPFKLGLDLLGGTHLVYQADLSGIDKENCGSSMEGLRDVIERRINVFGIQEPIVQVQEQSGHYRLIVELAGIQEPAEAIKMIGLTPYLEFKEPKENFQQILENNRQVLESGEGEMEEPFQATLLTGQYLEKAEMGFDQTTFQPLISIQFDSEGAKIFEDLTKKNLSKQLAIYIDGIPISSPVIQETIKGGRAQITGISTVDKAKALARNLSAGALPVPIEMISQQTIGPSLGKISLEKSLQAGLAGFLAVIIFLVIFYRLPGFLAGLALVVYALFILSLFKLIPVTLTLAGIGGFILSIGMAVDANILIFSRMREELRAQKTYGLALKDGFNRAWPSIRDGNLTTLLVALILFGFGTSFVKGFAFVLCLGILLSMFSAIFITQNFLKLFEGTRLERIRWLWK